MTRKDLRDWFMLGLIIDCALIICVLILAVILAMFPNEVHGCETRFCPIEKIVRTDRISPVTNFRRQRVGDIYVPGGNRRVQIRNNSRQIIGYIERSGRVTNTRRQKVGEIK